MAPEDQPSLEPWVLLGFDIEFPDILPIVRLLICYCMQSLPNLVNSFLDIQRLTEVESHGWEKITQIANLDIAEK